MLLKEILWWYWRGNQQQERELALPEISARLDGCEFEVDYFRIARVKIFYYPRWLETKFLQKGLHRFIRLVCGSEKLFSLAFSLHMKHKTLTNTLAPEIQMDIQHCYKAI